MTSNTPKNTYPFEEYEAAHQKVFATPRVPIKPILPPGVSASAFSQAVAEFSKAIGTDNVFIGDGLSHYIDPYDIWEEDESKRKMPSAAVCPSSTGQVSDILRIANKFSIPLWTFSRGKNLGYGGPAPRINGSVALDLHRMNKIIEVSDEFSYAVVEPGVTWRDLIDYCAANKKKVWPSTPSLSWGSVTGNTLDRGTGFGGHFNHHQCTAGLEIMLADGDMIRTGQWGVDGSPSAFTSKFTYGPSVDGLFVQSNLGIVTKLSIWMTPQPQAFMECTVEVPNFEDLAPLVDSLGPMRQSGLIPTCVWFMGAPEILSSLGKRVDFWNGEGAIPSWRLKELQKEHNLPYWVARWGLYGNKRVIQAHFDEIKDIISREVPTATVNGHLFTGENGQLLDNKSIPEKNGVFLTGVASLFSLPTVDWALPRNGKGKAAHGDYAPIIPNSGKLILEWMKVSYKHYFDTGVDPLIDFFMHERHSLVVNMFMYDQQDATHRASIQKLYRGLHQESKKRAYGMYRAHVNHMDLIAGHNTFNNYAYNRFVEKLKDSVDPNGILSPGKSGIWPKKYRGLRESRELEKENTSRL